MRKTTQPLRTALAGTTLLALITTASGAGFQLAERSAVGLGRAFSGEAAIADDASHRLQPRRNVPPRRHVLLNRSQLY